MKFRLLVNWLRQRVPQQQQREKLLHTSRWETAKVIILINWLNRLFQTKSRQTATIPSIFEQLKQARRDFLWAQSYYNSVTDKLLLDYATYEMLASQFKYRYLLRKICSAEKIDHSTIILNHLYERKFRVRGW